MEVSLSQETMEMLSTMIADKLSSAKTEKLVGIKILSKAINTPEGTIYHWVNDAKRNKIPFGKKGRSLQFKISEVQNWMFSRKGA